MSKKQRTITHCPHCGKNVRPGIARGEKASNAKLTAEQVAAIRAAPKTTGVVVSLAREYSVTASAISAIRKRKVWKHV